MHPKFMFKKPAFHCFTAGLSPNPSLSGDVERIAEGWLPLSLHPVHHQLIADSTYFIFLKPESFLGSQLEPAKELSPKSCSISQESNK